MATGGVGGVPTTTFQSYTTSVSVSNATIYTVASNTFTYVDLLQVFTAASGTGSVRIFSPVSGVATSIHSTTINTSGALSNFWTIAGNLPSAVLSRVENAVAKTGGSNDYVGFIRLYPGEQLQVTFSGSGATVGELYYSTVEVTSSI